MFGSIAKGRSIVHAPLDSEDAEASERCLTALGTEFIRREGAIEVVPATAWKSPGDLLDCGNSGTTMRLLSGLVASRPLVATLTGDDSLKRRPMGRIASPLREMGATILGEVPPLEIRGRNLTGITYKTPVSSAQIKSCILLAGLRAEGITTVVEPSKSRDHTERMLQSFGVPVAIDGLKVSLTGGAEIPSFSIKVPGDISSAAFFIVATALLGGSSMEVTELSLNPTRTGLLDVLSQAGVPHSTDEIHHELGEPVSSLYVQSAQFLAPFQISGDLVPRLIDEIPVLAVLASQCNGVSTIRDAKELRVKESDRIEKVASGLRAMGAKVETFEDGMAIEGPTPLVGTVIDANGDHRIGMSFAIAGLIAEGETIIENSESIQSSFPTFESDLWRLTTW